MDKSSNDKTYRHEHDVLLNWLPNNINYLYQLITEQGFKQEDFVQDDERWGGDNYPMQEDQRKALRIYWKLNPQYKFVWHEGNGRTQTYFEPTENAAFKYNRNYSVHDNNSGVLIVGAVNREFKSWLLELRKRLTEEKIAADRLKIVEEKKSEKPAKSKTSILPKKEIPTPDENKSTGLIDWDFEKK